MSIVVSAQDIKGGQLEYIVSPKKMHQKGGLVILFTLDTALGGDDACRPGCSFLL